MGYLYRPKLKSDARSENLVGEVLRERPPGAREYGRCCGHEDSAGGRALVPEGTRGRVATGRPVLTRAGSDPVRRGRSGSTTVLTDD